ncbi:MAG TPA: GMC family oxidoreductase [Solirubrobacterales bacterium]|jgi:cholesterol oxidase
MSGPYDAVIVGSGFGGGVTACRLAEAGKRVCVLERGKRFAPKDFPTELEQAPEMLWHRSLNPGGMFDVRMMRDVSVITAAGVGGGSLVYANVQLRAPADVFDHDWPAALDRAALDPWYDRTEEALQPVPTPPDPALPKVRAFAAAGRRVGKQAELLPLAVHFGEPREHPFSGVRQEGCQNLGNCDAGCPVNARNTVDITYIARAEKYGAEVRPLHLAERIEPPARPGGNWTVTFSNLGEGEDGSVEAPTLVLAAGTIGSSRLLLENRRRLPNLSPALGSRFSGDGDALGMAFDPQAPDVKGARNDFGPTMTSKLDYTEERGFILADGGLPKNFDVLLDVARGVNVIRGWRRWLLRLRAAFIYLGWSDQALRPRDLRLAERESDVDSLIFLMIGRDAADGRMRLTPFLRRFDIRWSKAGSARLFDNLERTAKELAEACDAEPFYALEGGPMSKFATVHPLGGCPMADDSAAGVVDEFGRVHGYPGLHILDGSIVPTALGVNPSKTIAALAERGADQMVKDLA